MRESTLQSLIKKHKRRIKTLRETQVGYDYPDMQAYYDWVELAKMYLRYRFPSNESVVEFCKLSDEPISREQQQRLLAILNAFVVIPQIIKNNIKMEKEGINLNVTVNNNNTQSQNQEQSMVVQQFLDAFRDELTGRQLKELRSVIAESDNDLHKAKPKIIDKLMEFGGNVASNILATLLTNSAFGLCL
jgi:hypothetical protein